MSKLGPRIFMLMALHSMCQPGRPSPHGLGQKTSPSSVRRAFQSAKSASDSFAYSSLLTRTLDDFVLHIRDVHHVHDRVALELKVAPDEVGENKRAEVADVRDGVHRRPAAI